MCSIGLIFVAILIASSIPYTLGVIVGNNNESFENAELVLEAFHNGDTENGVTVFLFEQDCTGNLNDVLCPLLDYSNDCTVYNSVGEIVSICDELDNEDSVFLVAKNRFFIWPGYEVGHRETITLNHMPEGTGQVTVETISLRPRVFKLHNFISEDEANQLIQNALSITDEFSRLKRSSTGSTGYNVDRHRTSENAFDISSEVAKKLKQRAFHFLGIRPYDESFADGIQVLRYNISTAYIQHMDWIEDPPNEIHNWDSANGGTNRFATLLFYLSDVEEGGETVFLGAPPYESTINEDYTAMTQAEALEDNEDFLIRNNYSHYFPEDSWEREMVSECRSRLAVKPKKLETVLFYSQHPDGRPDRMSLHGGCPVLKGTKWAANLWVWNGPRVGYWDYNQETKTFSRNSPFPVLITVETDVEGASLYWESQLWRELVPGNVLRINSFVGHVWNVKIGDTIVKTWVVTNDSQSQRFIFSKNDQVNDNIN